MATWWVGEQFNPDGSATYAVIESTQFKGPHPVPQPNQVYYGPYPSQSAAEAAENRAGQLAAKQFYLGKNVKRGPAGFLIPGNQGGNLLTGPDWGQIMIRIGEGLLGIVLIAIGLARITGTQNAVAGLVKARVP